MDKSRRKRRAVELGKNIMIVLLSCSALWLAARSQLLGPLSGLWREESPRTGNVQTQNVARADAARPLRMAANLPGGAGLLRYGVQYDLTISDDLFQQVAGLLVEALSSAGEPEKITRTQWEDALSTAPGMVFDFQGELPMPVLVGWLAGENTDKTAVVRRLVLTVWQETASLYYRDEVGGDYYRCLAPVASVQRLTEALEGLTENGALFAFESEKFQLLDPDTLLLTQDPVPAVYGAANPMSGGRASLEELMGELNIPVDASGFYYTGTEQVARSGSDSIRLSDRGVAVYEGGDGGTGRFPVPSGGGDSPALFESVEACRQLAAATLGTRCGEARLYLMSAQESGGVLDVRFGYCLNGAAVQLEEGYAARFLVKNGQITQFQLNFRSYTGADGKTSVVLPIPQAIAAMEALGMKGEELLLVYSDVGGDTAAAAWAAGGGLRGEE